MQADAQDGSGFNNANFTPSPDGEPGRIQMFLWTGPTPSRDGDLDAEVILHEYTHGLSTRLVGGGVGIGTLQTSGLGEGWSDFFALALLSQREDDLDASYAFGAYAAFQLNGLDQNYYFGIRRYPYSTDLNKNPLTLRDIDPAQISPHTGVPLNPIFTFSALNAAEVHSQGEVWCVMLWEARANLIRKHGYSVGNPLLLRLVTDGMKLSPPNPTFAQARDAIILADQVNNQGANYKELWAAFAKRGLGFSALSPDTSTTAGILEAYDPPDALLISHPADFIASGPVAGPFTPPCQSFLLTNISEAPFSWKARFTQPWLTMSSTEGLLPTGASTTVTVCFNTNAGALPIGTFSDTISFSNTVTHIQQTRRVELRVVTFTSMPFTEDFESGRIEPYWSVSGTGDAAAQVTSRHMPHGGNYHLTLDAGGGRRSRNEFTLGIDLGGYTNVTLRFWARSFGDEPDGPPSTPFYVGADFDGVAISEDDLTWYEVQELRTTPATYKEYVVDLDAAIAAYGLHYNSTFRIRFNHVDDYQIPFDGLALDDISIRGVSARRLAVTLPPQAAEGAGLLPIPGRVSLGAPAPNAVTVRLTSSQPEKVSVPATTVIPAGSDFANFSLTILDNSFLDGTTPVTIRAEAPGYFGTDAAMDITDSERAVLRVSLPPRAREGAGRLSKQGTVRANARPARDVLVQLTSSDPGRLQVPATLILRAGQNTADFDLLVPDNDRIDGPVSVSVTAHVDNWTDGSDTMSILDNDTPVLFVLLPPSVAEGNAKLTNAGIVRLSGRVPTNLVVTLTSSDLTELSLPGSVEVPAGALEAGFDLTPVNDPILDGKQTVTVTARAPGFATGSASLVVLDDETPAVPLQPLPPDLASNVSVSLTLSWNPASGNILVNGGFETGNFTGWTTENSGFGSWVINDGKVDPDGPDGPLAPQSGKFSVMTAQVGSGRHLLYQDVFLPPDALGATLYWWDRIRNHASYFASNQQFVVEVQDTNRNVLAVASQTQEGDALISDWQQRTFDLAPFRGRTVRLAFIEEDSGDYFNVHLDDLSVRLGAPEKVTTFDVYFGTTPSPGPAELRGNTTNASWLLPPLALNARYYWQIVARRGAALTRGPVWQFTTRGVGEVDHFEWGRIASPQLAGQRFPVTLTAKDNINNTVKTFSGPVTVTGLPGSGTGSSVLITELDIGNNDRTEFVNVTSSRVDLSGWQITLYDAVSWPEPLTTLTVPLGTLCPPGALFRLSENGEAPGQFPAFNAGTNVNWNTAAIGNPIAVLLRDAAGNVVDFVCAGNADPSLIARPIPIPATEWSGPPVLATLTLPTQSLQRVGNSDQNYGSDWAPAVATFGSFNPGLLLPFSAQPSVALVPSLLTNFVTGVWAGFLTVPELAPRMVLRADDGHGHFGVANEFAVGALNDVGVFVADSPDVVVIGNDLIYRVTITNTGPNKATGIVLTNLLPSEVTFLATATFDGVCSNSGNQVICHLDNISANDSARVTITSRAITPGVITNLATVSRAEPDAFPLNNSAIAVTTVTGPWISTTNVNITEGNSGTRIARVPVRLSAPCTLPVSVDYATSNATAIAGADYVATSGTLVFDPGITNRTIDVPILGDLLYENVETFLVTLSAPVNGVLIVAQSRIRINDDDPPPVASVDSVTMTEGPAGTTNDAVFHIRLSAPSGLPAIVQFTTADGTATAPEDYLTTYGSLTFAPGLTNQTIRVPVRGDRRFEPAETFFVVLTNTVSATLGGGYRGTCTILDNDSNDIDHFVWSIIPSPQFNGVPFLATLTAKDARERTSVGYNNTILVRGVADSREVIAGTGTNLWEYPFGSLYHDARTQVIYLPTELDGAGKIDALGLEVPVLSGQILSNWTIRVQHTSLTSYDRPVWISNGWTTVYQNDETLLATGWVTFLFSRPFDYNGTNALLVDFSFNNSTYSMNGLTRSSITSQRRSVFFQTDSAFGNPLDWSGTNAPPPLFLNRIPNARFFVESPVPLLPEGPVHLVNGVWSAPVTVPEPRAGIFLRASDTSGHIASGNLFTVESGLDADHDGLPDAWEIRYFGSTNAAPHDDPDGDGLDNLAEYRAGTDPKDASSLTAIQSVKVRGNDIIVRFMSVGGKVYRLERANGFPALDWKVILDHIPGTGDMVEAVDAGAASGGRSAAFYRVTIAP
jgi:uncharacterized repeat protein (TIGR01451 family)